MLSYAFCEYSRGVKRDKLGFIQSVMFPIPGSGRVEVSAMKTVGKRQCAIVVAASLMLNGCSVGGGDGFPDPDDAFMRGGTLESSRTITTIRPGMTKNQVRDLLGRPHFSEGLFNVRTWNYLFDLGADDGQGRMLCQFQLAFDGSMRVEDTQWRTAGCATRYSAIQAEPIESAGVVQYYHLPVAGTFTEDGALTDEGRRVLDEFMQVLQRDFLAPALSIASYPEPGRYRVQRQAVRRYLGTRGEASAELAADAVSPCREVDRTGVCRQMDRIVIEIRER